MTDFMHDLEKPLLGYYCPHATLYIFCIVYTSFGEKSTDGA